MGFVSSEKSLYEGSIGGGVHRGGVHRGGVKSEWRVDFGRLEEAEMKRVFLSFL
jgi:hypothetical protein